MKISVVLINFICSLSPLKPCYDPFPHTSLVKEHFSDQYYCSAAPPTELLHMDQKRALKSGRFHSALCELHKPLGSESLLNYLLCRITWVLHSLICLDSSVTPHESLPLHHHCAVLSGFIVQGVRFTGVDVPSLASCYDRWGASCPVLSC